MAKLMSKKTREIVQTTTFLVVVALLIIFYVIYPLLTVPDIAARADRERIEEAEEEYVPDNDASFFTALGLAPDTMTVLSNDNIPLASLYFTPDSSRFDSVRGTVILLHGADTNRTALSGYVQPLLDSGLTVMIYDQRACGRSGGIYHFGGDYEGDDLAEVVVRLNFLERLNHPVIAVGFDIGGDAILNAEHEEARIDYGIAVTPYLTTGNWLTTIRKRDGLLGIPLAGMVYFWWYQKHSGYSYGRTGPDDILPLETATLVLVEPDRTESDEVRSLKEKTPDDLLELMPLPENADNLAPIILNKIYNKIQQ